jgi:hypothetical protein
MLDDLTAAAAVRGPAVDLRAPFEGENGLFRASFQDGPGAMTVTASGSGDDSLHMLSLYLVFVKRLLPS